MRINIERKQFYASIMDSKMKSKIVTGGLFLLLMGVAVLAWNVITAEEIILAAEHIQPDLQIAAQP